MSPPSGGVTRPVCAICGTTLALSWPCQQAHPEHCHDCHTRNLAQSLEARQHRAPAEALVLSPREVAALVHYQRHVVRTVGTEALREMMLEDTP